jgi:hypothetical protein
VESMKPTEESTVGLLVIGFLQRLVNVIDFDYISLFCMFIVLAAWSLPAGEKGLGTVTPELFDQTDGDLFGRVLAIFARRIQSEGVMRRLYRGKTCHFSKVTGLQTAVHEVRKAAVEHQMLLYLMRVRIVVNR